MKTYYVYILTNRSGTLYTGVTNDLERRIREHRSGAGGFTARYRLGKLAYYQAGEDIRAAIEREKQIKGWTREKKLELIRSMNRAFKDLSAEWFRQPCDRK